MMYELRRRLTPAWGFPLRQLSRRRVKLRTVGQIARKCKECGCIQFFKHWRECGRIARWPSVEIYPSKVPCFDPNPLRCIARKYSREDAA